jgi:hypothetical protein
MAGCECETFQNNLEIGNLTHGDTSADGNPQTLGWARAYADTKRRSIVYKPVKDNRCPFCGTKLTPPQTEEAGDAT